MLKIKDNIELDKLIDYGFYKYENQWKPKELEYRFADRKCTCPVKMTIKKNRYISFNVPTIKTMEKFYEMVQDGLIEITKEKPSKEYVYMTKLELEKKIKQLEEENQKLKQEIKDITSIPEGDESYE